VGGRHSSPILLVLLPQRPSLSISLFAADFRPINN
jgi:hypothetical protein